MNFFQRQDEARRASRLLVVLFIIAVALVVVAVDLVVLTGLWFHDAQQSGYDLSLKDWLRLNSGAALTTTLLVLGIIGAASLYKTVILGGGGGQVAQSLGGVRVAADTTDPLQRRLLNVVEEMSIASGVPMPEVYLLEHENGINAFAAGHSPSNAAIGITRGALTTLDRSELQGVIAHEFSHILNGDMRLNLRLMGLLFGLLVIALIARTALRLMTQARGRRDDRRGGAAIPLALAFAVSLLIVGYVGLFFGRLIQAAVSRRREALADASAVQFTRDPGSMRDALVKIAANVNGSRIRNLEVEEVAHMLFAPGSRRLMATHPPLIQRIKAIDPRFDPGEIAVMRAKMIHASMRRPQDDEARTRPAGGAERLGDLIRLPAAPLVIAELVGNPAMAHVRRAYDLRKSLPQAVVLAGQQPDSARALLLALAMDAPAEASAFGVSSYSVPPSGMPPLNASNAASGDKLIDPLGDVPRSGSHAVREVQYRFIAQQLGERVAAVVVELQDVVDALAPALRITAMLRGFVTLRQLPRESRQQLISCLNGMMQRGGSRSDLHSYVLRKLAQVHLRDDLEPARRMRELSMRVVQPDARVLLSVLARHGHPQTAEARRAYEAGMHHVYPRERPAYSFPVDWASRLDVALSRLDRIAPIAKEQLVEAMVRTVAHDQHLTLGEAELLRAVCATLHCPLPPLIEEGWQQEA